MNLGLEIWGVLFGVVVAGSLKLVDKFTYFGCSISSTENDINTQQAKAWTAIDNLSVIWKSDRSDKIKQFFFQVVSIRLYGGTTWTLTKRIEKILTAITQECDELYWISPLSNNPQNSSNAASWIISLKPSELDEYDIRDTVGDVRTNHKRGSPMDPSHGRASVEQPARTYVQ